MPQVTVMIPTHNHTHTIGYAIQSVQRQVFVDFELFVVGDGAPAATRDVVLALAAADSRIRYFDFPKGRRRGEENRATAMNDASGRIVCYCCDDDLWLPDHLDSMVALLEHADVGHSQTVEIDEYDRIHASGGGIGDPIIRKIMSEAPYYNTGLTTIGHTMAAYRRLPNGWPPAPENTTSDLHLLRSFFAIEGLRFAHELQPSTIRLGPFWGMTRFPDLEQPPPDAIASDHRIAAWSERITSPDVCERLRRSAKESAARRVAFGIYCDGLRKQLSLDLNALRLVQSQNEQLLETVDAKDREIAELVRVVERAWQDHAELRKILEIKDAEIGALRNQINSA